jgi:murein DD-endopeptidase MepM/ murein hydrolase activator NlpD
MEPGLAGFVLNATVNGQPITTTTDATGNYRMVIPGGTEGQIVKVNIADPNAKDVALAMRYINQWNKQVTVPAYEMNGVKVPEQRLNDATIVPIAQGFSARIGIENKIGLIQGWITLPYLFQGSQNWWVSNLFDLNPGSDSVSLYDGRTSRDMHLIRPTNNKDVGGTGDNHAGIDFEGPVNEFAIASAPGSVFYINDHHVAIMHKEGAAIYETAYGHLNAVLVRKGDVVNRGQIIGTNGTYDPYSPKIPTHPHIHFGLYDISKGDPAINIDPFRDARGNKLVMVSDYNVAGHAEPAIVSGSPGFTAIDWLFSFSR